MKIKRPAQKYNNGFSEWVQGAANDASAFAESVFYVAWEAMNWPIGHFEQGRTWLCAWPDYFCEWMGLRNEQFWAAASFTLSNGTNSNRHPSI